MYDHGTTWHIAVDTGGTFTDCLARPPGGGGPIRLKVLSSGCLRGELLRLDSPSCIAVRHTWPWPLDLLRGYSFRALADPSGSTRTVVRVDPETQRLYLDAPLDMPAAALPGLFELRNGEEAPILAARLATGTPLDRPLPPMHFRLGTTKGTNALLEGKVAPVTLLVTRGFGDLLRIGTQQRPELFQLDIPAPSIHYQSVVEVAERMAADGSVVTSLTDREIERVLAQVRETGVRSVAIALLHAWAYPAHERQLAAALDRIGIPYRSVSHILSPTLQLLPRAQATVVNACLQPVLGRYLDNIRTSLRTEGAEGCRLHLMSSAGELTPAEAFHAKDSLLSGPAGGVVGVAAVARTLGFQRVIGFDMGGTSTDASRFDGQYDYDRTTQVGTLSFSAPCLAIETVAAGGGSICRFDGHQLVVGPESAGADPGPACYGAGGPLTLTDINLLLGKFDPRAMGIPVRREAARQALEAVRAAIREKTGRELTARALLEGFDQLANETMAEAIRRISIARGFDPADYALVAFGGAGGLHACQVAALLRIRTVILPFDAGLLSAYGIGQTAVSHLSERQVLLPLEACLPRLPAMYRELADEAMRALAAQGPPEQAAIRTASVSLRQAGQTSGLLIDLLAVPFPQLEAAYRRQYANRYGYAPDSRPLEVEFLRVVAALPAAPTAGTPTRASAVPSDLHRPRTIRTIPWETLPAGETLAGPAILSQAQATAFLPDGWQLSVRPGGNLVLTQKPPSAPAPPPPVAEPVAEEDADPIRLALFTNRFRAIALEMGTQLQRTARSVNIKERLDFSCALLDAAGSLLVNAPHIPVHLGSLGMCARHMLQALPPGPGDVILTNHPAYGGSHLPDLTLLQAVYGASDQDSPPPLIGYVINRAHHAELGGTRPGSMPPDARRLEEEGVVFPPCHLVHGGIPQWEAIEDLLRSAPYPSRAPAENLADLSAALASLRAGARQLRELADAHGIETLHRYMKALQEQAADALLPVLQEQAGQTFRAAETLDDGTRLCVRLAVKDNSLDIDFDGTAPVHPHNLNANRSIVYSVVLYVLRLLCRKDIPLNEGLLQRVRIHLPTGTCLDPAFGSDPATWPAVVGGNTELSQRLTDTLLKALAPVLHTACSQGTMNNFLFGNEDFGYYETIGGGSGAGRGFHGRSGVHQHMTNTRMTDPEELEFRYPVRLETFALREGSGGAGRWRGGDGLVRVLTFLAPVEVTVLSQHRREGPYGLAGGKAGEAGRQWVVRSGIPMELAGSAAIRLAAGDRITIETPGGGGYGPPGQPDQS